MRLPISAIVCLKIVTESDSSLIRPDQVRTARTIYVEVKPGIWVKIPRGYVTDYFSVPLWLWSLFRQFDNHANIAAIVHDWLYENWEVFLLKYPMMSQVENPRLWSDKVFYELLSRFRNNNTSRMYYYAIRLGGGANWKKYRSSYLTQLNGESATTSHK